MSDVIVVRPIVIWNIEYTIINQNFNQFAGNRTIYRSLDDPIFSGEEYSDECNDANENSGKNDERDPEEGSANH